MMSPTGGFDARYTSRLIDIEERHFWFRARNDVIVALARQIVAPLAPGYRVLDAGCGTGNTLMALQRACPGGRSFGMDLFPDALPHARRRTGCPVVQADIRDVPFGDRAPFHLVGLFDVLEHVADDGATLADLRRLIAPGGALLLTVPADPSLWSYFDEAIHHCRRYTVNILRSRLHDAGYKVEYVTPFIVATYPLVWAGRRIAGRFRRAHRADAPPSLPELRVPAVVNPVLAWALGREARLVAARRRLPFGTSIVAIARPA